MRFGILGALSVTAAGREVAITAARDRVVLAMLLLHPGRIVGADVLIDAVWEDGPPATARGQLQTCVSRLRRDLPPGAILTDPAGYGIRLGDDDLDAAVFTRLVDQARAVAGADADAARKSLREALALWRGPALTGLDAPAVRHRAAALDERHAVATEDWAELELAGGGDPNLVAELTGLVERFPLRERLRGQLMLSLCRIGRQADALAEYRRICELLQTELGIDPGPALQEMQRRVLTGDIAPAAVPSPAPVRCLPRTVGDFTGREDAVRRLVAAAAAGAADGPALVMIDGMAGCGKTTLALHVASQVGDGYPDAHLFLDLQGHSENEPLETGAALLILLRQLGVQAELIPAGLVERVALWRTELSRRRALVVLDNAASSAQITSLLPTSAGSLGLITSRRRLAGLDSVRLESLPVLSASEAYVLLEKIVGFRVAAEPTAALEVVQRCGRLPLAIRLAGSRLAHRPRWRVTDLVRRLGESVLPELAAEDRTVASAFALSYRQLSEPAQRVFRLLGLHPGERFETLAVAALTGLPRDRAQDVLDDLVDVNLIEEPEPELFRLHDLLRQYAAALAGEIPAAERRAAVAALLDFHLHAIAATNPLPRREHLDRDLRLDRPDRPDLLAALADPSRHIERERPYLPAFVDAGLAIDRPDFAWRLPRAAWRHLYVRGYMSELELLLGRGLTVARDLGDQAAVATSANYLASCAHRRGRQDEARTLLEEAARLRRGLGDDLGLSTVLGNLGAVYDTQGRFAEMIEISDTQRGLRVKAYRDDRMNVALRYNCAGLGHLRLGELEQAQRFFRLRLQLAIEMRETVGVATVFLHLAMVKRKLGARVEVTRRMLTAALRLYRAEGYASGESEALAEMALVYHAEGRTEAALDLLRQALAIAERIENRRHEGLCRSYQGEVLLASGEARSARESYERALKLMDNRFPFERATALAGLGSLCAAQDDPAAARIYWGQALELFTRMGVPERLDVGRRLAALESGTDRLRSPGDGGRMES
ncbi:AfsR/SARP family transcriptional regulator [Actinoplanes sp. NPDC049668]|uniref:AfsR/SARP family transcriptional regulator n=1 Tax=unclassified Actinoplanes TaxID=2626549 RepID=UPI0033A7E5E0